MIGETLKIGQKVKVVVPKENRDWGYNPCPDGTIAEVVGFETTAYGRVSNFGYEPGIYLNHAWIKVKLPDSEVITIGSFCLEPINKEEYEIAAKHYRENRHEYKVRVGDLPETAFWEGDRVRVRNFGDTYDRGTKYLEDAQGGNVLFVSGIDYNWMTQKRNDGSPMPFYRVGSEDGGWYCAAHDSNMELVERGNVWKYYHNEKLEFPDLKSEAEFFSRLGHTDEVRNPANKLYKWTLEEALDAIQNGIAHSFSVGGSFTAQLNHNVVKFRDEELGKRLARETLKGFNRI